MSMRTLASVTHLFMDDNVNVFAETIVECASCDLWNSGRMQICDIKLGSGCQKVYVVLSFRKNQIRLTVL